MQPTQTFEISARGPFDFTQSVDYQYVFGMSSAETRDDQIDLAFVPSGAGQAIGVRVSAAGNGIRGEVYGEAPARIAEDVARIFSLDLDGSNFAAIGERDPEIAPLLEFYAGSRPVLFTTPYEAAAWTIISQRVRMTQAGKVKHELEAQLGEAVAFPDRVQHAFPSPERIRALSGFPGLMSSKIPRLQAVAAVAGSTLDAGYLRSLPEEIAEQELLAISGIGPFSAELILLRGAGFPDRLPITGRHMSEGIAKLYRLRTLPDEAEIRAIAESWRPYRGWVAFLLHRLMREDAPLGL